MGVLVDRTICTQPRQPQSRIVEKINQWKSRHILEAQIIRWDDVGDINAMVV
jgi:hypothetical protein